jgi:excisionase family DNA binding protein
MSKSKQKTEKKPRPVMDRAVLEKKPVLKIHEAAFLLNFSESYVYHLIMTRKIRHERIGGRIVSARIAGEEITREIMRGCRVRIPQEAIAEFRNQAGTMISVE